jgi:fibronectin-binding autotransporter adhesin
MMLPTFQTLRFFSPTRPALAVAVAMFLAVPALGANRTWTGDNKDKGNDEWSHKANWAGDPPSGSDDLVFGGMAKLTSNDNDISGLAPNSITFNNTAGNFTLSGDPITLNGTVTNNSANSTQTIALPMSLTSGAKVFNAASGNLVISGPMSGTGGITKTGTHTLTLSGANTYAGGTTLSAGTLVIGNASALGSSNATLTINAGSLNLNGTSITVGNLTGTGGTITSTSSTNRTLTLGSGNATGGNFQGVIEDGSGITSLVKVGSGTIRLSGNNTYTGTTTIAAGTLQIGNAGTSSAIADTASVVNSSSLVYDRIDSFTAGYAISGTGSVSQIGSGTVTLSGTNSYSGVTSISSGTLAATLLANGGSNSSIGASTSAAANLLLGNGAAFRYTGSANVATDRGFTINGTAAGHGATIESSGTGTLSFNNSVAIAYGTADQTRTLALGGTNTGANVFGKVIANNGTGAVSLVKNGPGLWILDQNNTFTGTTTIAGGTLQIGNGSSAGSIASTSNVVNNGLLVYNRTGNQDVPYAISGNGSLTRGGSGRTVFTAANTYTGTTTIEGSGSLQLGNGGTTGSLSPSSAIINNATFASNRSNTVTQGVDFASVISGTGIVNQRGEGGSLILNGVNTYTGATRILAGTLVVGADAPSGSAGALGNATTAVAIGTGNTVATGGPGLLIGGNFTVGRDIVVHDLDPAAPYNATLGGSNTSGISTFTGNITLNNATANYTFTLQAATGGTVDFTTGNWTTNNRAITVGSAGNLGTVRLFNTFDTSGTTTVAFGTLLANNTSGSATGTGAVNVNSGATFGGTGSIAGALTIHAGGTLSPGASIETLATGTVTFDTGSTFEYEVNSDVPDLNLAADLQIVNGDLDLFGIVDLDLFDLASSPEEFAHDTTFTLFNYAGEWNGGLFRVNGVAVADGEVFAAGANNWRIWYEASSGGVNFSDQYVHSNYVNIVAVPEPPMLALLVAGGLAGLVTHRHARRGLVRRIRGCDARTHRRAHGR